MSTPDAINGQSITTTKARPRLGHSASAKWARKQVEQGNCRQCGKDRRTPEEVEANVPQGQGKLKQHCRPCQNKVNAYMQKFRTAKKQGLNAEDVVAAIEQGVETTVEVKETTNVETRTTD